MHNLVALQRFSKWHCRRLSSVLVESTCLYFTGIPYLDAGVTWHGIRVMPGYIQRLFSQQSGVNNHHFDLQKQ